MDHAKVAPLSEAALVMWMRCACWAQKEENKHTNGFIPAALLPTICRLSAARAKKLANELVNSRVGGTKEHGLWEPRDGGWQFHDWEDYQPAPETKLSRSEAASIAGRRSAEARRLRHGTAQPSSNRTPPNETRTFDERFEGSFDEQRSSSRSSNDSPNVRTPDPDPVRARSSKAAAKGLTGNLGSESVERQQLITFPSDLDLTDGQKSNLQIAGVPPWAIERMMIDLRTRLCADESTTKTIDQWRKYAGAALTRRWSDPSERPIQESTPVDVSAQNEARKRQREAQEAAEKAEARRRNQGVA